MDGSLYNQKLKKLPPFLVDYLRKLKASGQNGPLQEKLEQIYDRKSQKSLKPTLDSESKIKIVTPNVEKPPTTTFGSQPINLSKKIDMSDKPCITIEIMDSPSPTNCSIDRNEEVKKECIDRYRYNDSQHRKSNPFKDEIRGRHERSRSRDGHERSKSRRYERSRSRDGHERSRSRRYERSRSRDGHERSRSRRYERSRSRDVHEGSRSRRYKRSRSRDGYERSKSRRSERSRSHERDCRDRPSARSRNGKGSRYDYVDKHRSKHDDSRKDDRRIDRSSDSRDYINEIKKEPFDRWMSHSLHMGNEQNFRMKSLMEIEVNKPSSPAISRSSEFQISSPTMTENCPKLSEVATKLIDFEPVASNFYPTSKNDKNEETIIPPCHHSENTEANKQLALSSPLASNHPTSTQSIPSYNPKPEIKNLFPVPMQQSSYISPFEQNLNSIQIGDASLPYQDRIVPDKGRPSVNDERQKYKHSRTSTINIHQQTLYYESNTAPKTYGGYRRISTSEKETVTESLRTDISKSYLDGVYRSGNYSMATPSVPSANLDSVRKFKIPKKIPNGMLKIGNDSKAKSEDPQLSVVKGVSDSDDSTYELSKKCKLVGNNDYEESESEDQRLKTKPTLEKNKSVKSSTENENDVVNCSTPILQDNPCEPTKQDIESIFKGLINPKGLLALINLCGKMSDNNLLDKTKEIIQMRPNQPSTNDGNDGNLSTLTEVEKNESPKKPTKKSEKDTRKRRKRSVYSKKKKSTSLKNTKTMQQQTKTMKQQTQPKEDVTTVKETPKTAASLYRNMRDRDATISYTEPPDLPNLPELSELLEPAEPKTSKKSTKVSKPKKINDTNDSIDEFSLELLEPPEPKTTKKSTKVSKPKKRNDTNDSIDEFSSELLEPPEPKTAIKSTKESKTTKRTEQSSDSNDSTAKIVTRSHATTECDIILQKLNSSTSVETFTSATTSSKKDETVMQISNEIVINVKQNCKSSLIKNNDPEYHSMNQKLDCLHCDKPWGHSLINHYVIKHPDCETFPSRLPPESAELLRNPKELHKCERARRDNIICYEFKQYCYFCDRIKTFNRSTWLQHIAVHTGCYEFQCTNCSLKTSMPKKVHSCGPNSIEKIKYPPFHQPGKNIYGYLCDLCNFIRFNQNEIEKHLNCEHEGDVTNRFKKVLLAMFPKNKRKDDLNAELQQKIQELEEKLKASVRPEIEDKSLDPISCDEGIPIVIKTMVDDEDCTIEKTSSNKDTMATDETLSSTTVKENDSPPTIVVSDDSDENCSNHSDENWESCSSSDEINVADDFPSRFPSIPVSIPPKAVSITDTITRLQRSISSKSVATQRNVQKKLKKIVPIPLLNCKKMEMFETTFKQRKIQSNAIPLKTPSTVSETNFLKITNVTSFTTGITSAGPEKDSVVVYLKQWTKNPSLKSQKNYKKMLRDKSLFALYKCMDFNCSFATNNTDNMLIHLQNHENTSVFETDNNYNTDPPSWLECAYCDEVAGSCLRLVKHIQHKHQSSIFQCRYCFYRSSAECNVELHLKQFHKYESKSVLVCPGNKKLTSVKLPSVFKAAGKIDSILYQQCPYSEEQLNYMSPSLLTSSNVATRKQQCSSSNMPGIAGIASHTGHAGHTFSDILSFNKELQKEYIAEDYDFVTLSDEQLTLKAKKKTSTIPGLIDLSVMETKPESFIALHQHGIDNAAYNLVQGTGFVGYDLYRCSFKNCHEKYSDGVAFKVHLLVHNHTQKGFKCYHCPKVFNTNIDLLQHIEIHGYHRYFCCYCAYTAATVYNVRNHMKFTHNHNFTYLIPLNKNKSEEMKDLFVVFPKGFREDELERFSINLIVRNKCKLASTRNNF